MCKHLLIYLYINLLTTQDERHTKLAVLHRMWG